MEKLIAMTEEEIKVKYVLPWLEQAGIALDEMRLELSFSLKIGRQSVIVGETKSRKRDSVGGRLDILVQRNGRNLLIVETKADGLPLTGDDRDQAISYARLVHPIAPYAVVTNGSEYRLYDSVTKAQIDPKQIKINGFEATLPDEDIFEAQSLFLKLNPANLITFCRSQVAGELRIVKGTLADGRKYVPELHVPRSAILKDVMEFYRSPLPGQLLTGQSGFGKTCEMCWLAETLLDSGNPVLFFNGSALAAGIIEAIAEEFAWTFNGSDLPVQVVRRMAKLAGNQKLIIVIDAIDEWIYPSRENHLGSLLSAAENNNIKIIASCKTSAVEMFTSVRGNPTKINLLTKKVEAGKFSEREFYSAIDKYRETYQFFGLFESEMLSEARENPFLLRVLFDVAKNSNLEYLTFSSADFFETYFHRSISRTADKRQAEETLKAIAGLLYQHNVDRLDETEIRIALNLTVNESIMGELFEYGILMRSEGEYGTPAVGFYFQQLRDYIVAFKVLRFNSMSQKQLAEEFEKLAGYSVRADVFTLYYRLAKREHKIVIDSEVRENATRYLHLYTSLIEQHFPALRETFNPQTQGRIGFIGELLFFWLGPNPFRFVRGLDAYGFRAIKKTDDNIHFIPVQQSRWGATQKESNLVYLEGATQLHSKGSPWNWGVRDGIDVTKDVIDFELLPQLEELIKQGMLNESNCPEMLVELIVETVLQNKAIFKELLSVDGRSILYPLKLDEILKALLREKLFRHYRDELVSKKRKNGEIEETWNGCIVSYSSNLTVEDEKKILDATEDSLNSGRLPSSYNHYAYIYKLDRLLTRAINWLRPTMTKLDGPLIDSESKLKASSMRDLPISDDDAKGYLVWLYTTFLKNYKTLIETNFPTLKQHFHLYSKLPISVHLRLGDTLTTDFRRNHTNLEKYSAKSHVNDNQVKIVDNVVLNRDNRTFSLDGEEFRDFDVWRSSFESLFFSRSGLVNDAFQGMTLRKLVYGTIVSELKDVKQAFRTQCKNVGTS